MSVRPTLEPVADRLGLMTGPEPPTCRVRGVEDPIVDPILAVLPELEERGAESVPAPVGWPRDVDPFEASLLGSNRCLEGGSIGDRLALVRRVGAELVTSRSGIEVGIGLLRAELLDGPLDPDLTTQRLDVPEHRGSWVLVEVMAILQFDPEHCIAQ